MSSQKKSTISPLNSQNLDTRSPTKRSSSLITTLLEPEVVGNGNLAPLEMADHLLVMANRSRKMLLQHDREILPHTLKRIVKSNGNCSVESAQKRLNELLAYDPSRLVGYISVSDAADKLAEFETASDRLRGIAMKLDAKLSAEVIE
jgi:hypothetical protein